MKLTGLVLCLFLVMSFLLFAVEDVLRIPDLEI